MAKDKCSCAEGPELTTGTHYDEPMSLEQMAENFALYGLNKRAAALKNLDTELRGEVGSGAHALRRHARLLGLCQKMAGVHEALRKAKR